MCGSFKEVRILIFRAAGDPCATLARASSLTRHLCAVRKEATLPLAYVRH